MLFLTCESRDDGEILCAKYSERVLAALQITVCRHVELTHAQGDVFLSHLGDAGILMLHDWYLKKQ